MLPSYQSAKVFSLEIFLLAIRYHCNKLVATLFIASAVLSNAAFGEGTGRIWMSGLACGTTELSLFDCSSITPIGSVESSTSCTHADDASVRCQGLATGN